VGKQAIASRHFAYIWEIARATKRTSHLILCFVLVFGLPVLIHAPAFAQAADQPKLTVSNIGLNSTGDGYYNANVNLTLQRANNPQVNFGLYFQHIKTLDELYAKLRPAVDDLAGELKRAEIVIPH
jgi:hypothetical protein